MQFTALGYQDSQPRCASDSEKESVAKVEEAALANGRLHYFGNGDLDCDRWRLPGVRDTACHKCQSALDFRVVEEPPGYLRLFLHEAAV